MKFKLHYLGLIIAVIFFYQLVNASLRGNYVSSLLLCFPAIYFIFSLLVRKKLSFKGFFTSRFNIFTTKEFRVVNYDIPRSQLFQNIIKNLENSDFKLIDIDKDVFELLAISEISFKSWGENIYLSFEENKENEEHTTLKFCSTTFCGIIDWGKNEENYNQLLTQIAKSSVV